MSLRDIYNWMAANSLEPKDPTDTDGKTVLVIIFFEPDIIQVTEPEVIRIDRFRVSKSSSTRMLHQIEEARAAGTGD